MRFSVRLHKMHFTERLQSSEDIEIVPMDSFELERLIGDVSISINQMQGGPVQGQLLDLCERLEYAERYGDGLLEQFGTQPTASLV